MRIISNDHNLAELLFGKMILICNGFFLICNVEHFVIMVIQQLKLECLVN
ncbi:hypothetical protein T09_9545 [Trichinella sp. T9]|nr:hypothetical protein T09_9545 [Trichinella sp. T9]